MQNIQVSKWGNSLGVRIPRGIVESLGISEGDKLELTTSSNGITLRKVRSAPKYRLDDILDCFPGTDVCEEVSWGEPRGREVW